MTLQFLFSVLEITKTLPNLLNIVGYHQVALSKIFTTYLIAMDLVEFITFISMRRINDFSYFFDKRIHHCLLSDKF